MALHACIPMGDAGHVTKTLASGTLQSSQVDAFICLSINAATVRKGSHAATVGSVRLVKGFSKLAAAMHEGTRRTRQHCRPPCAHRPFTAHTTRAGALSEATSQQQHDVVYLHVGGGGAHALHAPDKA